MKRLGVVIVSLAVCCVWYTSNAEASQFSDGIGRTWGYLFSPVNCVSNLATQLVSAVGQFVVCVLNNANPHNLIP